VLRSTGFREPRAVVQTEGRIVTCVNCGHEIREGGVAPASEISDAYKTTTTGSINLHRAHDNCPGVGLVVTQ
jgi:hypothetical protein